MMFSFYNSAPCLVIFLRDVGFEIQKHVVVRAYNFSASPTGKVTSGKREYNRKNLHLSFPRRIPSDAFNSVLKLIAYSYE